MKNKPIGLQHVGLPVSDFDKSLAFYKGLGFEPIALKRNFNDCHVAMVQNGSCVIEIYESLLPGKNGAGQRPDGRWDHLALECPNIEEAYNECVEAGCNMLTEIEPADIWEKGGKYFLFSGPDGERIEFAQKF